MTNMTRLIVGLAAGLLSTTISAADWTTTAKTLNKSVVFVSNEMGSCTGFVVNDNAKGGKDYVLTANHCYGNELYADGSLAKAIFRDVKKDLMILEVDDLDRPALALAPKNPEQGAVVASFGFGMGLNRPMLRVAEVSDDAMELSDDNGPFVAIDAAFVPGQSGGPVVNINGEVVAIVQMGTDRMGVGVGVETIHDKIKRFLKKQP